MKEVQPDLKKIKIVRLSKGKLEFRRDGETILILSEINRRKATFKINGIIFDLNKIKTMEALRERGRYASAKSTTQLLIDLFISKAHAVALPAALLTLLTIIPLISLLVGSVIPALTLKNDWAVKKGIKKCKKIIFELISNLNIIALNTVKDCKDKRIKVERDIVPAVVKSLVVSTAELSPDGTEISRDIVSNTKKTAKPYIITKKVPPKATQEFSNSIPTEISDSLNRREIALSYIGENFSADNFKVDEEYCDFIRTSLKKDLLTKNPIEGSRAALLHKSLKSLPSVTSAKIEDSDCLEEAVAVIDKTNTTTDAQQ